jgi:hypothetical protein
MWYRKRCYSRPIFPFVSLYLMCNSGFQGLCIRQENQPSAVDEHSTETKHCIKFERTQAPLLLSLHNQGNHQKSTAPTQLELWRWFTFLYFFITILLNTRFLTLCSGTILFHQNNVFAAKLKLRKHIMQNPTVVVEAELYLDIPSNFIHCQLCHRALLGQQFMLMLEWYW